MSMLGAALLGERFAAAVFGPPRQEARRARPIDPDRVFVEHEGVKLSLRQLADRANAGRGGGVKFTVGIVARGSR
jgi:hypothetical protein